MGKVVVFSVCLIISFGLVIQRGARPTPSLMHGGMLRLFEKCG